MGASAFEEAALETIGAGLASVYETYRLEYEAWKASLTDFERILLNIDK